MLECFLPDLAPGYNAIREFLELATPSLRAKRSNPEAPSKDWICFVASLLAMTVNS
jgi:hypothetical protein